ncbi:MAG: hypothetical protein HW383_688, partial [Candidatus Magasanikbacteria bacterium]|nr:hypothetical protein [Candidatus Magasanikbacteria bacterium]
MVQERSAPTDVGADSVGKGKGLGVYVKAHVDALTAAVWDTEADFSCLELLKDQQITLGPWKVSVWVIGASNLFVVHHTAQFAGAFVLACGDGVQRVHTNPCATVGFAALKRGGRYNVLAGQRVRLEMDFEVRPLRVGARTTVNSSWHSSANRVALAVGFPVDTDREIEVIKDPHVYTDPR